MARPLPVEDKTSENPLLLPLLPPPGRLYVRSFLFARRIDAPFAKVHLIARVILALCLSAALLRTINTAQPDIIGASLLWCAALCMFLLSGISVRVAKLYTLLTLPALLAIFVTWTLFNPIPGTVTLLRFQVYSGQLAIGLAPWQAVLLLLVGGYFLWTRKLALGIVIGIVAAFIVAHWLPFPEWSLAQVAFFHPLTVLVSNTGLLTAITKVIGYAGMVLATIALVVSARDVELIGALRQLHVPHGMIFFLATVFRSLDLALADYDSIHQAQVARAIHARPRSFLRRLRDLASIAVPMVAMMIRRSSEIGDALLARGYTLGRADKDFYETSQWRLLDWSVVALSLCLLYLALGPHPPVTALLWRG